MLTLVQDEFGTPISLLSGEWHIGYAISTEFSTRPSFSDANKKFDNDQVDGHPVCIVGYEYYSLNNYSVHYNGLTFGTFREGCFCSMQWILVRFWLDSEEFKSSNKSESFH